MAEVGDEENGCNSQEEQEEAMVALIEHRSREVQLLKKRISYYTSQLKEAEKRLSDTESKLARLRRQRNAVSSCNSLKIEAGTVKVEKSSSPIIIIDEACKPQPLSKPELVIPAAIPKISQPAKLAGDGVKSSNGSSRDQSSPLIPSHSKTVVKVEEDKLVGNFSQRESPIKDRGIKRKLEQQYKEHKELIPLIRSSASPSQIHCHTSNHISSQHKRKLRSLISCPVNDQLFVTSALDGVVSMWELRPKGSGASLLSSNDCVSPKQRRWPEDIAWHPEGSSLFLVYSADRGDSQVAMLNLNKTEGKRLTFLEDKPHIKGIINSIIFLPWDNTSFVTGGSDHAVIQWIEKDGENTWKPKALHRSLHSSAVMGVAGMQQKPIVLSAGADKRIIGFDVNLARTEFRHQIESKCMSILPNPCDFNLFMVQTGTPGRQLRLFDIRLRQTELHAFGWKQESSESQSALINQAWSPDGLYLTSGSADPVIHLFDIRYNLQKPSQSIKAHQKRVFKAIWLQSLPLLISISSDWNIGLHKIG